MIIHILELVTLWEAELLTVHIIIVKGQMSVIVYAQGLCGNSFCVAGQGFCPVFLVTFTAVYGRIDIRFLEESLLFSCCFLWKPSV